MKILKIELDNIRNLKKTVLDLNYNLVLFIGQNAQGKTNLLEAIYFLAITKHPRKGKDRDIVNKNKKQARIIGFFEDEERNSIKLEFLIGSKKIAKINDKIVKLRQVVGLVPVVIFTADDLNIIESPQKRRRFIDILLSLLDKPYFVDLVEYKQALKRRNKLLYLIKKNKAKKEELLFWDDKISLLSEKIIEKRQNIFEKINQHLLSSKFFDNRKFNLKYKPQAKTKNEFLKIIKENQDKDIALGFTSFGPHRDEINFYIDGLKIDTHGSRGEKRSLIIELKKAEIAIIKESKQQNPILLLDDVFAELDVNNSKKVKELISDQQTILTVTDKEDVSNIVKKAKLYSIKEGLIS